MKTDSIGQAEQTGLIPVPSSGATGQAGFAGYFVCCFQFPEEIQNFKSLREERDLHYVSTGRVLGIFQAGRLVNILKTIAY